MQSRCQASGQIEPSGTQSRQSPPAQNGSHYSTEQSETENRTAVNGNTGKICARVSIHNIFVKLKLKWKDEPKYKVKSGEAS